MSEWSNNNKRGTRYHLVRQQATQDYDPDDEERIDAISEEESSPVTTRQTSPVSNRR